MTDPIPEAVSEALSRHGLHGPELDAVAIAEAMAGWDQAGGILDLLLSTRELDAPDANPTSFSPKW